MAWLNPQILSAFPNPKPSILHLEFYVLHFPFSYLNFFLSNLNSPSSTLLFPSSVKSTGYLTQSVLKIGWFPTKCPQALLAILAAGSNTNSCPTILSIKRLKVVTICWYVLSNIHELLHGENCVFPWEERSLKSNLLNKFKIFTQFLWYFYLYK